MKELWQNLKIYEKIWAIILVIMTIAAHVLAIWGLIDDSWVKTAVCPAVVIRIFCVILLIGVTIFDTIMFTLFKD